MRCANRLWFQRAEIMLAGYFSEAYHVESVVHFLYTLVFIRIGPISRILYNNLTHMPASRQNRAV